MDIVAEKVDQARSNSIVDRVIELQKQWPELVTPRSKEFLLDLQEKDLIQLAWENGQIIITSYIQPLREDILFGHPDQIFRVGGFSSDRDRNISRKKILLFMKDCEGQIRERKYKVIIKNGNSAVTNFFKKTGYHELSYSQCWERFPEFLEAYLRKSKKCLEYYADKYFCIYHPEFCI